MSFLDDNDDPPDTFTGVVTRRQTEKALLCVFPKWGGDDNVEVWVPQSQIHEDSDVYKHPGAGVLAVKPWWTEKALEEYRTRKKTEALRRAAGRKP